eukprot:gnl/TRDRNA2_/TRDRNA2_27849_c0_seq1.p1 gnl/TRDRNA2_/TRDRNA2_27849_c0~~gnl/TRDRNA2_/TRDRNA2_27849_c0_seq1.p1  ORF type:complete len:497 (-),score=46.70 gnl/TRDRNA2_/TRDRNA2_27849_c0_seq1:226-1716(-)
MCSSFAIILLASVVQAHTDGLTANLKRETQVATDPGVEKLVYRVLTARHVHDMPLDGTMLAKTRPTNIGRGNFVETRAAIRGPASLFPSPHTSIATRSVLPIFDTGRVEAHRSTAWSRNGPHVGTCEVSFEGPDAREAAKRALALHGRVIDDHVVHASLVSNTLEQAKVLFSGLPPEAESKEQRAAFTASAGSGSKKQASYLEEENGKMLSGLLQGIRFHLGILRNPRQELNDGPDRSSLTKFKKLAAKYEQSLDELYERSFKIKCPFMRRRAFDSLEAMKRVLLFIVARHKSTPLFPNPQARLPISKTKHLALNEIAALIHKDWTGNGQGRGYYVTGALTKEIYDEECIFDGPDPDMPVKGLRKYLLAASHLFDSRKSRADLTRPIEYDTESGTVTAYWRLQGVINLPWHPQVKPWTGSTTYHVDPESGLISSHREEWDISVPDAFISTLFPWLNFGAPAAEVVDQPVIDPPRPVHHSGGKDVSLMGDHVERGFW